MLRMILFVFAPRLLATFSFLVFLIIVLILCTAVGQGQVAVGYGCSGFLHLQPVTYGLVRLAVEAPVGYAVHLKIFVHFLHQTEGNHKKYKNQAINHKGN